MGKYREVNVHEFPLHEIPTESGKDVKIVVVGKPGSGKSVLIKDIVRTHCHKFPVGVVFSGTEDNNHFYSEMFDQVFIYGGYDEEAVKKIVERQKLCQQDCKNPKLMLIIDDCSDDPKFFRRPLFQKLFKMGRHMDMMVVLGIQYANDLQSVVKSAVDISFIFRDPNPENRKKIYNNYAGITGSLQDFNDYMDQITGDYSSLVINNRIQSNEPEKGISYYKARMHRSVKLGCVETRAWNEARFDPDYMRNMSLE